MYTGLAINSGDDISLIIQRKICGAVADVSVFLWSQFEGLQMHGAQLVPDQNG